MRLRGGDRSLLIEGAAARLPEAPWDEQLIILRGRLRNALLAHDGARVVAGTFATGPNTGMLGGAVFDVLRGTGLSPQRAGWAIFALGHFALGHRIEEQAQTQLSADADRPARLAGIVEDVDSEYAQAGAVAQPLGDHLLRRLGRPAADGPARSAEETSSSGHSCRHWWSRMSALSSDGDRSRYACRGRPRNPASPPWR